MAVVSDAAGRSADLRSTLLGLLADQESHGYALAERLSALGIDTGLTSLYRALRST